MITLERMTLGALGALAGEQTSLGELTRTSSGKLDRRAVEAQA